MVQCQDCHQEMDASKPFVASSCTKRTVVIGGKSYLRNTSYYDKNKRCHDCGIVNKKGNVHHFGCDIERCPKCRGQLISCGHGEEAEKSLQGSDLITSGLNKMLGR